MMGELDAIEVNAASNGYPLVSRSVLPLRSGPPSPCYRIGSSGCRGLHETGPLRASCLPWRTSRDTA